MSFSITKKLILVSLTVAAMPLVGCSKLPHVDSLKNGLIYLNQGNNYTITCEQGRLIEHSYVYQGNSIGLVCPSNKSADKIYYQDGYGVYSIGYNGNSYVGSSYYDDISKSVWSGKFYSTMKNVATDYINNLDGSISSLIIKDKDYRVGFLKTVGYSSLEYVDMDDLTVTYKDGKLTYTMMFRRTEFVYTAKNFGSTENKVLSSFLSNGGKSFTPNEVQIDITSKMKGNNYDQQIFQFGDTPETTGYVGKNYFNQNYFYTNYFGSLIANGHIALDGRESKSGQYSDIYGCYQFVLDYSVGEGENPLSIFPYAMYDKPNIPEFYNYPSYLSIWDHMEYCTKWDSRIISGSEYSPSGTAYMILDPTLVYEIEDNFAIRSTFDGAVPYAVGIDYIKNLDIQTHTFIYYIVLLLKFYIDNNFYVMPVPFSNFGEVKDAFLEAAIEEMKN